jgi:hypothetical protein
MIVVEYRKRQAFDSDKELVEDRQRSGGNSS